MSPIPPTSAPAVSTSVSPPWSQFCCGDQQAGSSAPALLNTQQLTARKPDSLTPRHLWVGVFRWSTEGRELILYTKTSNRLPGVGVAVLGQGSEQPQGRQAFGQDRKLNVGRSMGLWSMIFPPSRPNCAVLSRLVVSDSATPWIVACQAPLSTGFPRQEYWSGSISFSRGPFEPRSPAL